MTSLKDQLLQAGLVDKSRADKAEREQRKKAHQKTAKAKKKAKKKGEQLPVDEARILAEKARQEQAERSRELNRQQREQAEQKAVQAQIRQLIAMNRIDRRQGEIAYQFADDNKIKSLYVTEQLQDQLSRGVIAVARCGDSYELVPKQVAEKIAQRDTSVIVVQNTRTQETADEDDPYADYQIPDDLMW